MIRRTIVLAVIASVMLAGCAGLSDTGADTPTDDGNGVQIDEIPGVSNSTVTDATALAEANGATIVETGGRIQVVRTASEGETESLLTVGSGGAFTLSASSSATTEGPAALDYYSNETATYAKIQSDGETRYRVVERNPEPLGQFNSSLETYLAAGSFTATNESTDPTTVVFTADEFEPMDDNELFGDVSSLSGRLVLSQSGQVQNLTITGQEASFSYELRQPIIERAAAPAWLGEIPPGASLHPELTIDVENDSHLRIEHTGGDAVPANATLEFSDNNTSGTATFDSPLNASTRYAYFAANDGSLVLTADKPAANETASLDSPASVTISTDNVTLYSASMGWDSESTGEGMETGDSESEGGQSNN